MSQGLQPATFAVAPLSPTGQVVSGDEPAEVKML
jgi:hypothetical protein